MGFSFLDCRRWRERGGEREGANVEEGIGKYEFVRKGDPPIMGRVPVTPELLKELEDRNFKLPPKKRAWIDTLPEHKRKLLKPLKP